MCAIQIQMQDLQLFVPSGKCGKTSQLTAGCDSVNSSLRAKKWFAEFAAMKSKSLETASKDCSAHIACILTPQYKQFSSQSLPRAHVAHTTHLEIKATAEWPGF